MPSKSNYTPLRSQLEDRNNERPSLSRLIAWFKSRTASLFLVSNTLMFIVGFLASNSLASMHHPSSSALSEFHHQTGATEAGATKMISGIEVAGTQCGHNWQEAKAMGCHFDVMASRWYSSECFEQEVLDEMLAEPHVNWNFTWYADKQHTVLVPPEKVFSGEFDKVYPNNLFHIKHCLHLWRKLHYAVLNSRPVDEDILDYEHTIHCTQMIMNWTDPDFHRISLTSAQSSTPFCRSSPVGLLDTH